MSSRPLRRLIARFGIGIFLYLFFTMFLVRHIFGWSSPPQVTAQLQHLHVRPATKADLDVITSLALASLHDDPVWPYRFTGAKAHPEHHYKYSRIRFSEYLDNVKAGVYQSMLVEAPSKEDPTVKKVIAMSMWSLPASWHPEQGRNVKRPSDHPERLDANPPRMMGFRKELQRAKNAWFDPLYGDEQLNLMILATHPDYRRRGAGKLLVQWGMDKVKRDGGAITLFSSPMGLPLYTKLGFKEVGLVHVQVEGEEDFVELPAMVWEPSSK